MNDRDTGYRGIWYFNQPSGDEFVYKYSGGLGTYCAKHRPLAVYCPEVKRTFFCYGGTVEGAHRRHSREQLHNGRAFDGERTGFLLHMVGYYDHETKMVPRPTILLDKSTADAHDNPVISVDGEGYVWIFSTSHGTSRPSYIHRSRSPYSTDAFDLVHATRMDGGQSVPLTNFSYMQPWYQPGTGFLAFFTHYHDPVFRTICFMRSADGRNWSEWTRLAAMGDGHYQVSELWRGTDQAWAGTAFNYHPDDANSRTNLYYMQTNDAGTSWTTVDGRPLDPPLRDVTSPALIRDYATEGRHVYLKDISYDREGRPLILYVTSRGYEAGPAAGPREWTTARWTGGTWQIRPVTISDSNYDTGCLYIEDETWRVIGPSDPGPQEYNPGGEMVLWESTDHGLTWQRVTSLTSGSARNHTYARRPLQAHPDFVALWADGNPREPSESDLFFCNRDGDVFRLPSRMTGEMQHPELMRMER